MKAQGQELVKAGKRNEKMLRTEKAVYKHKIGENLITWNRRREIPFTRKSQCKRSK